MPANQINFDMAGKKNRGEKPGRRYGGEVPHGREKQRYWEDRRYGGNKENRPRKGYHQSLATDSMKGIITLLSFLVTPVNFFALF